MYGQRFAKDLAGHLTTIRFQLLGALGETPDVSPEEPFVDAALTAAFRVHRATLHLWHHSQRPAVDGPTADAEESTGQYDPPGSDPNSGLPDLEIRLALWLESLEKRLIEEIHAAYELSRAPGSQAFIDAGVNAARSMAVARRALSQKPTAGEGE